jgi:hypothetical protein
MTEELFTFLVVEGEHQGRNRVYKKGEIFQSQYPLDTMFVNKFQRVTDKRAVDIPPKQVKPDTRMSFVFADAEDVSEQFPKAAEHNLSVFKDTLGGFAVTMLQEGVEPVNIAPVVFGSKKQVNQWISEYLSSNAKD